MKRYRIIVDDTLLSTYPLYMDTFKDALKAAKQWSDFFFIPRTVIIEAKFSNGWYETTRIQGRF